MEKRNADQLRKLGGDPDIKKKIKKNPIYIVLDDVLDTYNIGAIFRLADAVAAEKVILCRGSETPPNSRIKKASINTTEWVDWEYHESAVDALKSLKLHVPNIQIVAIEQDPRSVPFQIADYSFPIALVVGHETTGVSPEVLGLCDQIVELPMYGVNISLNVMVSLGITLYEVLKHLHETN
jgi:23S rRNA (guanosine2251-2'-O)-methyltransferase